MIDDKGWFAKISNSENLEWFHKLSDSVNKQTAQLKIDNEFRSFANLLYKPKTLLVYDKESFIDKLLNANQLVEDKISHLIYYQGDDIFTVLHLFSYDDDSNKYTFYLSREDFTNSSYTFDEILK